MKNLVIDLDLTLTLGDTKDYQNVAPNLDVIDKLKEYHSDGFNIIIYTARNMRTYEGNVGKINANTLPIIIDWLKKYDVPYDEIITGKPWCGTEGFYVDDKAIRPDEFVNMSHDQISKTIGNS